MKKFIMIAILSLLFIAPANATITDIPSKRPNIPAEAPIRNTAIVLQCWNEYPDTVDPEKEMVSIIMSPDDNIATIIDPHNDMITGKLTVSEYFYTITIDQRNQVINYGMTGVIKINRLSGVLSAVWTGPKIEGQLSPEVDTNYGTCVWVDRKQLF